MKHKKTIFTGVAIFIVALILGVVIMMIVMGGEDGKERKDELNKDDVIEDIIESEDDED